MAINWKVRIKNPQFWVSLIAAVLLLVKVVAALFGYEFDFGELTEKLDAVVEAVFLVLAILGIVNDPTTKGLSDSKLAMTYEVPKPKEN